MTPSEKKLRKALREFCDSVTLAIVKIDAVMIERDDAAPVASIVNDLEMAHDLARRFGLGESFAKIKRWKSAAEKQAGLVRKGDVSAR